MNQERKEEYERARGDAERFLEPIRPMLEAWRNHFESKGLDLLYELQVGRFPTDARQVPVRTVLSVGLKGAGIRSGWSLYFLQTYMPHEQDWLAAEIEYQIEAHLEDPAFGSLWDGVRDLMFKRTTYDRPEDHEHCYCCMQTIATEHQIDGEPVPASIGYVTWYPADPPYELWLCPRCFDYWSSRRNLIAL